ncbi:facilitated trehalose transporter Tret1-like isoform X2 [Athalia rosae]|uniref:facilitated trehalose transporter Tret1-like isoform X2 n=1 Tax=Athalia rosae TaxID=37344 RepID=UPI002033FA1F|nr:facilitated trehalose transporter Tret1-like isoform X2 [Athalia rosae]
MPDKYLKESSNGEIAEKTSLVSPQITPRVQPASTAVFAAGDIEKTTVPVGNGLTDKQNAKAARGSAVRQVLAAVAAQLGTINTGMVFGFSAIALPQLKAPTSEILVTETEASWIASINAIGTPLGCLFSGYLSDALGRKKTLIITEIPALLGWALITFSTDINMMYAGRFFVGLGSGMVGAPARVYAAEVTQPHLRGMLTALSSVGVSTGVFVEYLLGAMLSWRICAGISATVPLLSLILIFLFPETPSYLVSREKPDKARKALGRLRGSTCNLDKEMDTLVSFSNKAHVKRLTGPKEIVTALFKPNAIKPFIMLALYFLIYQWSGTNAITFYAVEIFQQSGAKMDEKWLTVILGVIRLAATVAACVLCRRCGRRPLTFVSSIGCGLSMVGFGAYKQLTLGIPLAELSSSYSWFPVFCIFAYTIACTIGFLVIPWVMIGEVYPVAVRGIVGGMTTMTAHLFVFTVVKTFPLLRVSLTDPGVYLLYGFIPLAGTVYFYFALPETQGRSLQEIEDYYSGRTSTLSKSKVTANKPPVLEPRKGQLLP